MGILERYFLWLSSENTRPIRYELIEFFKTKPTMLQLRILDRINRKCKKEDLILIIIMSIYGGIIGGFIGFYYGVLSVL